MEFAGHTVVPKGLTGFFSFSFLISSDGRRAIQLESTLVDRSDESF